VPDAQIVERPEKRQEKGGSDDNGSGAEKPARRKLRRRQYRGCAQRSPRVFLVQPDEFRAEEQREAYSLQRAQKPEIDGPGIPGFLNLNQFPAPPVQQPPHERAEEGKNQEGHNKKKTEAKITDRDLPEGVGAADEGELADEGRQKRV